MTEQENLTPRHTLKREKTTRVSFADKDTIETVISYEVELSSANLKKKKREALENFQINVELSRAKQMNEYVQKQNDESAEEKRLKEQELDANLNEIESKARIKSAQSKRRRISIENEKHKVEEDIRRRLLHEKDLMYEFETVRVKSASKLPVVKMKAIQNGETSKQSNTISIHLPTINSQKNDSPRNIIFEKEKTDTIKQTQLPKNITERDRVKAEEGDNLKKIMDNINRKYEETKPNQETKTKLKKTQLKEKEIELEDKRMAEENAKKVAEIKAQKARLLEIKKLQQYKIDHLKDRKEIKVRRVVEEEEKTKELDGQKKRAEDKQRRKEEKQAKKAAEYHAIQLAEELAKKRLEDERRQLEMEQKERAAKLQQDRMMLLSHRFLRRDFKNVK